MQTESVTVAVASFYSAIPGHGKPAQRSRTSAAIVSSSAWLAAFSATRLNQEAIFAISGSPMPREVHAGVPTVSYTHLTLPTNREV